MIQGGIVGWKTVLHWNYKRPHDGKQHNNLIEFQASKILIRKLFQVSHSV